MKPVCVICNIAVLCKATSSQCREEGGSRNKLPGLRTRLCCIRFCLSRSINICRVHKLALSDQAQVTLQLRGYLSDLLSRSLDGPT